MQPPHRWQPNLFFSPFFTCNHRFCLISLILMCTKDFVTAFIIRKIACFRRVSPQKLNPIVILGLLSVCTFIIYHVFDKTSSDFYQISSFFLTSPYITSEVGRSAIIPAFRTESGQTELINRPFFLTMKIISLQKIKEHGR